MHINFYKSNKDVIAVVKDNGKGFNKNEKNNGYGLKLTTERIAYFNQCVIGQQIDMAIDTNEETGTTVSLTFKNWL